MTLFRTALIALALLASACGSPDSAPEADSVGAETATAPALVGTAWRLAAIDHTPVSGEPLITVEFTNRAWQDAPAGFRSLGGYDGCNDFGMGYRLGPAHAGAQRVEVGGAVSNAMACGPPGAHISDSLRAGFGAARTLRIEPAPTQAGGARLLLTDSLGAERLAFVPRPVRSVDSTAFATGRWRLDPAASTVTGSYGGAPGRYEVAFTSDSTYVGSAGCRTFGGRYGLDGDQLWIASYALDDLACAPDNRMWDGPHGLSAGEVEVDDTHLTIHLRVGGTAVFRRPKF